MLEWVCPKCEREVDPAFETCPFCGNRETVVQESREVRRGSFWMGVERGFRFGLGFVAVLALVYFLLVGVAYVWSHDELLNRLTRWIYAR